MTDQTYFTPLSTLNFAVQESPYQVELLADLDPDQRALLEKLVDVWDNEWTGKDNRQKRRAWSDLVMTAKLDLGWFEFEPEEDIFNDLHMLFTPKEACHILRITRPSLYHRTKKQPGENGYVRIRRMHPLTAIKLAKMPVEEYLKLVNRSAAQEVRRFEKAHKEPLRVTDNFPHDRFWPGANFTLSKHKPANLFELVTESYRKIKRGRGARSTPNRKPGAQDRLQDATVRIQDDPTTPEFKICRIRLRTQNREIKKIVHGYRVQQPNGISYRIFPTLQSIADEYGFTLEI